MSTIKVEVLGSAEGAAEHAAGLIVDAIRANPRLVLGLATGSTPRDCYGSLAHRCAKGEVSFAEVTSFNLDEYWGIDGDHPQSYRTFMQENLFLHVDIRPWNTHVLNGRAVSPSLECAAFETKIQACGGVDLWLLGIGQNGHIAFNEPASTVDSRTRMVSLTASTIAANSDGRFFSNPADVPRCALSAGIGTIREARRIVLLATGSAKADAVASALKGAFDPACPASLLQDHPDCTFVLDHAAASKLSGR